MRKRRYCRVQKAMGDASLLAGSPADAAEHYLTAVDLARTCSDTAWHGTALAGLATAKVLLIAALQQSRLAAGCALPCTLTAAADRNCFANSLQILEGCIKSRALRSVARTPGSEAQPRHPTIARVQAEDAGSASSRGSSGFGGPDFWASLRQVVGLEAEVRALLADARSVFRRRSVLPLMVSRNFVHASCPHRSWCPSAHVCRAMLPCWTG
jgi:hypothetical protein